MKVVFEADPDVPAEQCGERGAAQLVGAERAYHPVAERQFLDAEKAEEIDRIGDLVGGKAAEHEQHRGCGGIDVTGLYPLEQAARLLAIVEDELGGDALIGHPAQEAREDASVAGRGSEFAEGQRGRLGRTAWTVCICCSGVKRPALSVVIWITMPSPTALRKF